MTSYALFSDTHGSINALLKELKKVEHLKGLLALGDHTDDAKKIAKQLNVPLTLVRGNCDSFDYETKDEVIFKLGNKKVLMTHGHLYGVKRNLNRLYYRAEELGCNLVFFGHTHVFCHTEISNVEFVNPGSAAFPRMPKTSPSWVLIQINDQQVTISKRLIPA